MGKLLLESVDAVLVKYLVLILKVQIKGKNNTVCLQSRNVNLVI